MNCIIDFNVLRADGADIDGINDRFAGDDELYGKCLSELLEEKNFTLLESSLAEHDYKSAFAAAHALKGLSGNLGVTPLYNAVCALVEALRANDIEGSLAEYTRVQYQLKRLISVAVSGIDPGDGNERTPAEEKPPVADLTDTAKAKAFTSEGDKALKKRKRILWVVAVVLAVLMFGSTLTLIIVTDMYKKRAVKENAELLCELGYQMKQYIEAEKRKDITTATSVADTIALLYNEDRSSLLSYISNERKLEGMSDISVYTENGYSMNDRGGSRTGDLTREVLSNVYPDGSGSGTIYSTVNKSQIMFCVPVNTDKTLNGSVIRALSFTKDASVFLDGMNFESFGGLADIYISQNNGLMMTGRTHNGDAPPLHSDGLTANKDMTLVYGDKDDGPKAYIVSGGKEDTYYVTVSVSDSMKLIYTVPERAVNQSRDNFSSHITCLSSILILVFALFSVTIFITMFNATKRKFDKTLSEREKMLDALTRGTRTIFALIPTDGGAPKYCSESENGIIGSKYLTLIKNGGVFTVSNAEKTPSEMIDTINKKLADWDGKSRFRSGFIKSPADGYFELQLIPTEENGDIAVIAQDMTALQKQ